MTLTQRKLISFIVYVIWLLVFVSWVLFLDPNLTKLKLNQLIDPNCPRFSKLKEELIWSCPPVELQPTKDKEDGKYSISLCVQAVEFLNSRKTQVLLDDFILKNYEHRFVSYNQLSSIAEKYWKDQLDSVVFRLYPQSLHMKQVINRIKRGCTIEKVPINNPPLRIIMIPEKICPSKESENYKNKLSMKYDIIVVVKTGVYNFKNRMNWRSAYSDYLNRSELKIGIVFSVGLSRSIHGNIFHRDGFWVILPERAGRALKWSVNRSREINTKAQVEALQYGDMLIGEYEDTYYNLTLKMMTNFQWIRLFCSEFTPTVMFIDDDYAFNFAAVRDLLADKTIDERENVMFGLSKCDGWPTRPTSLLNASKWSLSRREFPFTQSPCHPLGFFYILGFKVVVNCALTMYFTKHLPIDDLFFGLVANKLNLTFEQPDGIFMDIKERQGKLENQRILAAPFINLPTFQYV